MTGFRSARPGDLDAILATVAQARAASMKSATRKRFRVLASAKNVRKDDLYRRLLGEAAVQTLARNSAGVKATILLCLKSRTLRVMM